MSVKTAVSNDDGYRKKIAFKWSIFRFLPALATRWPLRADDTNAKVKKPVKPYRQEEIEIQINELIAESRLLEAKRLILGTINIYGKRPFLLCHLAQLEKLLNN